MLPAPPRFLLGLPFVRIWSDTTMVLMVYVRDGLLTRISHLGEPLPIWERALVSANRLGTRQRAHGNSSG